MTAPLPGSATPPRRPTCTLHAEPAARAPRVVRAARAARTPRGLAVPRLLLLAAALAALAAPHTSAQDERPAGGHEGPQRILILGGTGFLGPQVVEAATARGHAITLFNRGRTRPELFKDRPEIEILHGDRDGDLASLKAAIDAGVRWDAVVDTSGYVPRIVKDSATLLAPAVEQYVFISSISVFAEGVPPGSDESAELATMPDETNEEVMQYYGALKALCEKAAEAALPGRTTNIRPGLIVGPGDSSDRFSYWPVRIARGGQVLCPGDGQDPVQIIDVRDLAEFVVHCIEQRSMGVFNATGPERVLTMKELVDACAAAAGAAATNAGTAGNAAPGATDGAPGEGSTPAELIWVATDFLAAQGVAPWSDMPVWVPRGPDNGFSSVNCSKAIAAGLRFRPVADTVDATLAWWATLSPERRAKLRSGIAPEREAEVLAAWEAEKG